MRAVAMTGAFLLAGCMVGPDYKRPDQGLPAAFTEPDAPGTVASSAGVPEQWWKLYNDPVLDGLVADGLAYNADVQAAAARVEEAEARLREAHAVLYFPEINGNAGVNRGRSFQLGVPVTATVYSVGISTSFEVDVWGHLRRGERAVRDNLLASRYGRDTVALTLAATVARTYFAALSLDSQYASSEESRKAAEESLALARRRLEGGVASALDVYQAGAISTAAAAQSKEIARQRAAIVHALGVLTGRFDVSVATRDVTTLPVPPLPPAGLPSQLLERRPDVRQAEAQLASATELIGVARAEQFPTLSLTGSLGTLSTDASNLFTANSHVWSLGAGLLGPILDGGRYRARTDEAVARAKQAEAAYRGSVRDAFRDVSDALSNIRYARDTEADLQEHLQQSREALRLSRIRYERGYSPFLEVLDATRTLNDAELTFIRNRQNYLSYTVDLMNSLGGGWKSTADESGEQKAAQR
jgi:multidrug efflux system outer membrane protein